MVDASTSEKLPVSAAATAKRMQTRPEASFSSDSPSRMCISRFGIGTREVIEETATGSVGEITAASAKATASGMAGIIQWMTKPSADNGEDDQAERELKDGALVAEQPVLGNAPAVEKQQRRQEQEEKDLRVELDAEPGDRRDQPAQDDLDQRQGDRQG